MAKLLAVLAFALVALSAVSALRTTTITTKTIQDNGWGIGYDGLEDNGWGRPKFDGLEDNGWGIGWDGLEDNGWGRPKFDGLGDNGRYSGECRRQIPMEQLNHCQMHLSQQQQLGILKMVVNPRKQQQQEQQHLQQCCSQLQQVSPQCQCEAIQQVFDESRQHADVIRMRQMLSKAERLPSDCSLEVQDCPIRAPRV
uniref:PawS-like protein 1a n=1 Tax=Gaillardia pulchella TaxID=128738 RepID=A0A1V0JB55_GAIPU|nr:PawS-like protein 1a [Gaillardia pulchella]